MDEQRDPMLDPCVMDMLLDERLEDANKMRQQLNTLIRLTDKEIYDLQRERILFEDRTLPPEKTMRQVADKYEKFITKLGQNCAAFYRTVHKLHIAHHFIPYSEAAREAVKFEEKTCEIVAGYFDKTIYVKAPIMPIKSKYSSYNGSHSFIKDYSTFFRDAIMRAMIYRISNIEEFNESDFAAKSVQMIFIYPDDYSLIPDNDNHDIKTTLDAVTFFLPNGDSGSCCDLKLLTRTFPNCLPATYITVSQGLDNFPPVDEVVPRIRAMMKERIKDVSNSNST